jgi:hypothetical protein
MPLKIVILALFALVLLVGSVAGHSSLHWYKAIDFYFLVISRQTTLSKQNFITMYGTGKQLK